MEIAKRLPVQLLVPNDAVDVAARELSKDKDDDYGVPADTANVHAHYVTATRAAFMLLDTPPFARVARLAGALEEEFTPGGPPMSPIYDSHWAQHVLCEVPQGLAGETPYSVLAKLLERDHRRRLVETVRSLAGSRFDLYRVPQVNNLTAVIEPIRGKERIDVNLSGPFLRTNDFILARVLYVEGKHYIFDSPYLLKASEGAWLDYLERIANKDEAKPALNKEPKHQLSSKQKARLKEKRRQTTPEQSIAKHLKFGDSERYWFDYVMDAYAGERRGIVYLEGVPDEPESLPHSPLYQGETRGDLADPEVFEHPPVRLREKLKGIAQREGLVQAATAAWQALCDEQQCGPAHLEPNEVTLFDAYCTLGARNDAGQTALDLFVQENPSNEDQWWSATVDELQRGWFSVFRIDRIKLDEGFEAFDVLRRRKLYITEHHATRHVAPHSLLLGWVTESSEGVVRLEGGVCYVPAPVAPMMCEVLLEERDRDNASGRKRDWKTRASELPLKFLAALRVGRKLAAEMISLHNTSGDPIQLATARLIVRDEAKLRQRLTRGFTRAGDDRWHWLDENEVVLADLELRGDKLLVHVNSLERLHAVQDRVEDVVGDAASPSLSSVDGSVQTAMKNASQASPAEVPREVLPQLHAAILDHVRAQFDVPIPMFKHKSLRQLARGKRSKADAIGWLREQERVIRLNPQFSGVDCRPLWHELGLEYQGLDTDTH